MNHKISYRKEMSPFLQLLTLAGFGFIGLFLGQFIAYIAVMPMLSYDLEEVGNMFMNATASEAYRTPLLIAQGLMSLIMFGGAPLAFISITKQFTVKEIFVQRPNNWLPLLLLGGILTVVFMPIGAYLIHWNQAMKLPESMATLEHWMRVMEDTATNTTQYLLQFESSTQFAMGLLVIAVLPGLLEEFLFRGVLQNLLQRWTGNGHLAIWISAFAFSAIHFQFYGFLPRMVLGALFGYLYFWSGNLIVPIFAHFVNNAYTVIGFYLQKDLFGEGVSLTETELPSLTTLLVSLVLAGFLAFIFRKLSLTPHKLTN